jgi:hypothetical protein
MPSFTLTPTQLSELLESSSYEKLTELGGIDSVANLLHSDKLQGLSSTATIIEVDAPHGTKSDHQTSLSNEHSERIMFYGVNSLPSPPSKPLLVFAWEALQDRTLMFLGAAAVVVCYFRFSQGRK